MADTLWITFDWRSADADLPIPQQEQFTEVLFREMNGFDEVERVERVADPTVPTGGMGAAWLWGILTAEVSLDKALRLTQAVQERLPSQPINVTLKRGSTEVRAENVRSGDVDDILGKLLEAVKALPPDEA
ncbi:MAG: hypothetical protein O3C67_03840 [Cyanobacteria bacterium]|nr:hypothetical protein [Cyanobacteriota bacterium]MEB3269500.1 hypothetical protein [Leptolyngbya sp.]